MLLDCDTCGAKVSAKEHAQYEYTEYDETEDGERFVIGDHRVFFLECPACGEPMVATMGAYDGRPMGGASRLYPPFRRAKPRVPETLRRFFDEALRCLRSRSFLAALLMCRRTLEGVCHEKGATSGTLDQRLKKLNEAKVIDDRLYAWADALREDGNLAAHDPKPDIGAEDARDVIGFTEAILDYVFVLHDQFERFQERRAERVTKSGALKAPTGGTSGG